MLVQQYEMFKRSCNEIISRMFAKFNIITNDLSALDKSYNVTKLLNKILKRLPKDY